MRDTLSVEQRRPIAKKRLPKLLIYVGAVLMACWVLYVSMNVAFPAQGEQHGQSDVVVSLAPQYHRLYTATQLIEAGHADTLAISHFDDDVGISDTDPMQRVSVTDYCDTDTSADVICFTPQEVATIGEAFEVRDIAERESWESLTVVTSRTHAFRAYYIFERCVGDDVDVNLVHADPELNVLQWSWHLAYENAAFIKALLQTAVRC